MKRLIRIVHDNEGLLVANNLLSGPAMRIETQSKLRLFGNVSRDLTDSFVNAAQGNLHLKEAVPGVADSAEASPEVLKDIDNQTRGPKPDIGADEYY